MFSGIPLPKVVADTPVGGNVLGAMQAGQNYDKTRLQNSFYPQLAQAQVAQQQAQAASAPLNAMAQIATNPMIWATMTPDQRKQMSNYLSNSVLNTQSKLAQMQNPQGQQQSSGNPLSYIYNVAKGLIAGNSNSQPAPQNSLNSPPSNNGSPVVNQNSLTSPQQPQPQPQTSIDNSNSSNSDQYTPNLPQGTDVGAGVASQALGKYAEGVHAPSTLYVDKDGNPTYTPSQGTVSQYQTAIDAISRTLPVLERLQNESKEFLEPGGRSKLLKSELASTGMGFNIISPEFAKKHNLNPEMVSRYNKFVADQNQVKESLSNSFVYPHTDSSLSQIGSLVTPGLLNEGYDGYAQRIGQLKDQLTGETLPKLRSSLRLGYNVSGNNKSSNDQTSNDQQQNRSVPTASNEGQGITYRGKKYTNEDILLTAHKYHMTPSQLRQALGA